MMAYVYEPCSFISCSFISCDGGGGELLSSFTLSYHTYYVD